MDPKEAMQLRIEQIGLDYVGRSAGRSEAEINELRLEALNRLSEQALGMSLLCRWAGASEDEVRHLESVANWFKLEELKHSIEDDPY